jgi:hypothetical protein
MMPSITTWASTVGGSLPRPSGVGSDVASFRIWWTRGLLDNPSVRARQELDQRFARPKGLLKRTRCSQTARLVASKMGRTANRRGRLLRITLSLSPEVG